MELSGPRRRPAPREPFGNPEVAELAYGSSDDPPGYDDDDLPDESSQSGEAQAARAGGRHSPACQGGRIQGDVRRTDQAEARGGLTVEVHFHNQHGSTISIAIMRFDPAGCGEYGNWATAGWWNIALGQEVHAFNTDNRYFAYYAEAQDGAIWAGDRGPVYVYSDAFNSCLNIGSTAARGTVLMKGKDGGGAGRYTVNLN